MPREMPYKLGTDRVYCFGTKKIPNADVASFRILNHIWACDQKTVYGYGVPLKKADPATFVMLNQMFANDKQFVFDPNGVLKGVDPANFEALDEGIYQYDQRNGFGDVVHHDDQYISYARDRSLVYLHVFTYKTRVVKNADRASFEVIKYGFARDQNRVYFEGTAIKKADPATFEPIGRLWSRDASHVFYGTSVIAKADPGSFALIDEYKLLARDRTHFFIRGTTVPKENVAFGKNGQPIGMPLVSGLRLGIAKVTEYLQAGADPRREPQALALACHYHDLDMVRLLLDHGADPNSCDPLGNTPVLATACYNRDPMPIVQFLLDAGADVNGRGNHSPLQSALMAGKYELAEYLVSRGADVNVKVESGQSLLEYAKWLHTPPKRVIQFLEEHGAG